MISKKTLISIAPLKEETKNDLLQKLETMEEEKQMAIVDLCWDLISSEFLTKLGFTRQNMMLEMASGEKTYTKEDFDKVEEDMFSELLQKLDAEGNDEKIDEVRKQLEEHSGGQTLNQNTSNDPTNSDNNPSSL